MPLSLMATFLPSPLLEDVRDTGPCRCRSRLGYCLDAMNADTNNAPSVAWRIPAPHNNAPPRPSPATAQIIPTAASTL
jgi:hypothetical protein